MMSSQILLRIKPPFPLSLIFIFDLIVYLAHTWKLFRFPAFKVSIPPFDLMASTRYHGAIREHVKTENRPKRRGR